MGKALSSLFFISFFLFVGFAGYIRAHNAGAPLWSALLAGVLAAVFVFLALIFFALAF